MSIFALYILFLFISTYFSKSVDLFSINKISGARLLHSTVRIWNDKEDRTIELVCFPPKRMHCHTHTDIHAQKRAIFQLLSIVYSLILYLKLGELMYTLPPLAHRTSNKLSHKSPSSQQAANRLASTLVGRGIASRRGRQHHNSTAHHSKQNITSAPLSWS